MYPSIMTHKTIDDSMNAIIFKRGFSLAHELVDGLTPDLVILTSGIIKAYGVDQPKFTGLAFDYFNFDVLCHCTRTKF